MLTIGMGSSYKGKVEKPQYYGFDMGLVHYTYDTMPFINKDDLFFPNGMTSTYLTSEETRSLFPDSIFPLEKQFKNDSSGKRKLGIPTGIRRYSIREVEPIISGRATERWYQGRQDKTGFFTFHFDKINFKGLGLVRIKDTNIYFIMPLN